jgi:hypothetical protein
MKVFIGAWQVLERVQTGTDIHFAAFATIASSQQEATGIGLDLARENYPPSNQFFDYRVACRELDPRIIEWIKSQISSTGGSPL